MQQGVLLGIDQDRVGVLAPLFFEGSPQQLVYSLIFVCQSDRL
ncbi:hypothetical protein SAN_2178 [Streptococcus agalactiae COH1]|nr:hypothetical protein SAN_2195 [Streptococcus agalactiae COH1]EAO75581.1 hypothetical protein SAN_2178 [Streptococcus agalactiae COH1]